MPSRISQTVLVPALMRARMPPAVVFDPLQARRIFCAARHRRFSGTARFTAPDTLTVEGRALTGRHILIASGARPVPLGFPGAEHAITSGAFMEVDELPARIGLVGGGYIAAEFAHLAARAGAKASVLQRGKRMLPQFDLVESASRKASRSPVRLHVEKNPVRADQRGHQGVVMSRMFAWDFDGKREEDCTVPISPHGVWIIQVNADRAERQLRVQNSTMRSSRSLPARKSSAVDTLAKIRPRR